MQIKKNSSLIGSSRKDVGSNGTKHRVRDAMDLMLPPHSLPLATLVRKLRSERTVKHRSDNEKNSFGDLDNLVLPPDTILEVVVELVSVEESPFTTGARGELSTADRLARALFFRRTAAAVSNMEDNGYAYEYYNEAYACVQSVSNQLIADHVNVLHVKRNSNLARFVSDLRSFDSTKTPDNNVSTNGVADSSEVDDTVVATVSASGISQLLIDLSVRYYQMEQLLKKKLLK